MIQQTSLFAWHEIQPRISASQQSVLDVIRENPGVTDKDIAKMLGWEINRVTPRRGELEKMGKITHMGIDRSERYPARMWKAREEFTQRY